MKTTTAANSTNAFVVSGASSFAVTFPVLTLAFDAVNSGRVPAPFASGITSKRDDELLVFSASSLATVRPKAYGTLSGVGGDRVTSVRPFIRRMTSSSDRLD